MAQQSEHTADYMSVYIEKEPFGEIEVCIAIVEHGSGKWEFWGDTGYEFNEITQPDLVYQVALNSDGEYVELTKAEIDKAIEMAAEQYWEKALNNEFA